MADQIVELIDVQQLAGQEILNVFHYLDTTGALDPAVLAADYVANAIPALVNFQSSALTHVAVRYRQVYPAALLTAELAISPVIPGDDSSSPVLASCDAFSMKWSLGGTTVLTGGFTGHLKRGGMRLGGITEQMVDGNVAQGSYATGWGTIFATLAVPSSGWQLVVASYLSGNSKPRPRQSTVQAYATITGTSVPAPSTQNTRKVLRGITR